MQRRPGSPAARLPCCRDATSSTACAAAICAPCRCDALDACAPLPVCSSCLQVPILSNLSEQQLFQLARCMANRSFGAGEVVFRQGEAGDTFYVVEEGSFR